MSRKYVGASAIEAQKSQSRLFARLSCHPCAFRLVAVAFVSSDAAETTLSAHPPKALSLAKQDEAE
jgi:hypothetical protein